MHHSHLQSLHTGMPSLAKSFTVLLNLGHRSRVGQPGGRGAAHGVAAEGANDSERPRGEQRIPKQRAQLRTARSIRCKRSTWGATACPARCTRQRGVGRARESPIRPGAAASRKRRGVRVGGAARCGSSSVAAWRRGGSGGAERSGGGTGRRGAHLTFLSDFKSGCMHLRQMGPSGVAAAALSWKARKPSSLKTLPSCGRAITRRDRRV